MRHWSHAIAWLAVFVSVPTTATPPTWKEIEPAALVSVDDDVIRNISRDGFFTGITMSETRFSENGFNWHLIRFVSVDKPAGPNWVVPHDDENAAFDAMIAAIHKYGGTGVAVNSGKGSARRQSGFGICGVRSVQASNCDPNRNFDARSPMFTAAFVNMFNPSQPVIALHTNSHGFAGDGAGGRGNITIYDAKAFADGKIKARKHGRLALNPSSDMANSDSFALSPFLASLGAPPPDDIACGKSMARSGIHFWYEPVRVSDGSLSNYLLLNRPNIRYLNAESRAEIDYAPAARRHAIMIAAYLEKCMNSGDYPATLP